MKLSLMLIGVIMVSAVIVLAAPDPDTRFKGGEFDGYDTGSTNSLAIPEPPPKGTIIRIM